MKWFTESRQKYEKRSVLLFGKSLNGAKVLELWWELSSNTIVGGWQEKSNTNWTARIYIWNVRAELAVPTSVLRSYQRCRCSVCLGYGFAFYLRWNSKVGVYCKIRYNCLFVFSCLSKKTYFTRDTFETVAKCDNSYFRRHTKTNFIEVEMSTNFSSRHLKNGKFWISPVLFVYWHLI